MPSLRRRALVGSVIAAFLSVLLVSVFLFAYIDRITLARFDRAMTDRHVQVALALSSHADDPATLETTLSDPAYQRTLSGRYWQVTGPDGTQYTSRSLFGSTLSPQGNPGAALVSRNAPAPDGGEMRVMSQRITLEDGSRWDVAVAENLRELQDERAMTRKSLLVAFGVIAVFGLGAALVQTAATLRPLVRLREDVAKRWDSGSGPDPAAYPAEVSPLVADINTLIARNRDMAERARRQSADLAHALKTPTAILRNEIDALSQAGHDTARASEALARVDAQLGRSLARMRAANAAAGVSGPFDLSVSIDRFRRLFGAMAERGGKRLSVACDPDLKTNIQSQDAEEILGNLLDNALKWGRSDIRLSARRDPGGVIIRIEDDGPGIPEDARHEVLDSGRRLDESKPGTGLGLAIASDLATAYGATLELGRSATLGGLSASLTIPQHFGLATR